MKPLEADKFILHTVRNYSQKVWRSKPAIHKIDQVLARSNGKSGGPSRSRVPRRTKPKGGLKKQTAVSGLGSSASHISGRNTH